MASSPAPRLVRDTVIVAAALALAGYRFAHLDLAAFARDEPQFLAAARAQLASGHWLSANPLYVSAPSNSSGANGVATS